MIKTKVKDGKDCLKWFERYIMHYAVHTFNVYLHQTCVLIQVLHCDDDGP